eukprot:TRINITY_DN48888_c0_g1_i1.p1 TRINITY_DN48888_c0_g1~~TRINITY_DN48888_c0_g1_i1.p1  ORF type:complete len:272 (-),score=38.07 TRINITY_DN48888_c0_g1_i1:72-887(-)
MPAGSLSELAQVLFLLLAIGHEFGACVLLTNYTDEPGEKMLVSFANSSATLAASDATNHSGTVLSQLMVETQASAARQEVATGLASTLPAAVGSERSHNRSASSSLSVARDGAWEAVGKANWSNLSSARTGVNSTASARSLPSPTVTLDGFMMAFRYAHNVNLLQIMSRDSSAGPTCSMDMKGETIGCKVGCHCNFLTTCYSFVTETNTTREANMTTDQFEDVGVCSLSAPALFVVSTVIIITIFICFAWFLTTLKRWAVAPSNSNRLRSR